jgi:DNA-directed RNA polymerase specialized sigma24 family protein
MLEMLDHDESVASDRYLNLRDKLIMYFEGRRISPSEDLADEVLHRVAKKIGEGEVIRNINQFAFGVARFVRLETFRGPPLDSLDEIEDEGGPLPSALRTASQPEDIDRNDGSMQFCLRQCLSELRDDQRKLLYDYYEIDEASGNHIEQRKRLAARLKTTAGALQKQICLLRKKVGRCSRECLERELDG